MSKITTERHYKITLTGGSTYYGRTTLPDDERYRDHLTSAERGKHDNKNVQESYDKYGHDDWSHEWLGTETGNTQHHNQIEYGYVRADPKSLNIHDGKWTLLSKEEKNEYFRLMEENRKKKLTPKELEEHLRKDREKYHNKLKNMTPEELEETLRKRRERNKRILANETSKQREERLIKEQQKRDNRTPEEYEEYRRKDREYGQRRRDEKKRSGDNK
mgnify:CR=1 FL=1